MRLVYQIVFWMVQDDVAQEVSAQYFCWPPGLKSVGVDRMQALLSVPMATTAADPTGLQLVGMGTMEHPVPDRLYGPTTDAGLPGLRYTKMEWTTCSPPYPHLRARVCC